MPVVRQFVLIGCVAVAGMALGVPSAFAATPTTAYDLTTIDTPFPQETGRFGERHAATDDLDGDGVNDYFVGALSENVSQFTDAGRVYAISGRTRTVIYDILSPEIQDGAAFGFFIAVLGDVDGDGKNDVAAGTDAQDTTPTGDPCTPPAAPAPPDPGCNNGQGKAWVFSGGKRGRLLYEVNNPDPQPDARFGSRIGRAGDVNDDGVPESIMGASNNDVPAGCGQATPVPAGCRKNQGQAYIFNGKDGTLVRELNVPASDQTPATCSTSCGSFGLSVQGPGDVDGDGVVDQLVSAASLSVTAGGDVCAAGSPGCNAGQGAMYLFSGDENGKLLARIDDPAPQPGAFFGFQDAAPLSPGDVNGDGRADLFANGFRQDGPGPDSPRSEGRIWVFDGKATVDNPAARGVVRYEPRDPTPSEGGQFAFSLDKTDYNKDGRPDLYVGQSPHHLPGTDQSGGTYVFDGRDGSLLKSLELPPGVGQPGSPGDLGSNLGWSVAAPGDLNGDSEPDFLAAATFQNVGDNKDEGRAFVFLSNVPAPGPGPGGPGLGAGVPAFGGCGVLAANVIRGTAAGNSITGTPGADRIFAGTGGDVVDALAGSDCVDLGPGDDRGQGGLGDDLVVGGLGADRISGSSGDDRLRGNGANDRIDAGRGNDRAFGDAGNDVILGGFGNDRLHGVSGNDRIGGSRGRDRINGGAGRDLIAGGSSNDRISGDRGNDRINGNSGSDVLKGNSGNDRIVGGTGRDVISGGSGSDRVDVRDGKRDRVNCGRGRDTVIADPKDRVSDNCERVVRRRV